MLQNVYLIYFLASKRVWWFQPDNIVTKYRVGGYTFQVTILYKWHIKKVR